MLKEFRNFLFRGNLIDLATAVILGVAFNAVVQALVNGILMPLIAAVVGKPSFDDLTLGVGDGVLLYGTFLTQLVNFIIVAAVIFLVLKAATKAQKLRATTDVPDEDAPPPTDEAVLLAEIRDLLRAGR